MEEIFSGRSKLVASPTIALQEKLWQTLRLRLERLIGEGILRSNSILFVDGFLEEHVLMRLIASSDFYISTSFAEGFNMPVVEAMTRGSIVISPMHTAMVDYLTPDNCIPCNFHLVEVDGEEVTGYPIGRVNRCVASVDDIVEALRRSATMTPDQLDRKRELARSAVVGKYDVTGTAQAMMKRIEEISVHAANFG